MDPRRGESIQVIAIVPENRILDLRAGRNAFDATLVIVEGTIHYFG
jgi:hypothetical protein